MRTSLDVVICTYNREDLLLDCVDSLRVQTNQDFTIYVVNNYNQPLKKKTKDKLLLLSNLIILHEKQPGLSIARNAAIAASESPWIAFLDDDAKVDISYIGDILSIAEAESWACFGGGINSWWKYGRPRWLDVTFGAKPELHSNRCTLSEGYNWGSNIIINRSALEEVNGFPTYIGMKGKHIGYAAENIVQIKLRNAGYTIGYDPALMIDHVVAKHKLNLKWHIKSYYATGRDGRKVFPDQYGLVGMMKTVKSCLVKPSKGVVKLFSKSDYYPENLVLDILQPMALLIGKLKSLAYSSSSDS